MFVKFVFLCTLLCLVRGQTTLTSQCTRNQGELPINTHIEGCIDPPCLFAQLDYAVMDIIFRAPRTITTMRTVATAYLFGTFIGIPYDLQENSVTCNFLENTYCPVVEGEVIRYTLRMYIESFFPAGTSATVEFRIQDDDQVSIMCIRVPILITSPNSLTHSVVNNTLSGH